MNAHLSSSIGSAGAAPEPGRRISVSFVGVVFLSLLILPYLLSPQTSTALANVGEIDLEADERQRFEPLPWEALGGYEYIEPYDIDLDNASPEALVRRHEEVFPASVRALDGKSIALRGYVIPVEVDGERVRSFVLAAKNEVGCCFGAGLAMNQWVFVNVPKGQELEFDLELVATVMGKLSVGEELEEGYVLSLYRLAAEKIRVD